MISTDSPINPSGLSYHAGMEALVRYGKMSAEDVLRAANAEAAAALGYEGRLGVVVPSVFADLPETRARPNSFGLGTGPHRRAARRARH